MRFHFVRIQLKVWRLLIRKVRLNRGKRSRKESKKGRIWMPRLTEAMKDGISRDKLRVGAITLDPEISEWDNLAV